MTSVVVVVVVCVLFGSVRPEGDTEDVLQKPEVDVGSVVKNGTDDDLRVAWKKCFHKFSAGCVSLTLTQLASRLPSEGIRVAPGLRLIADTAASSSYDLLGAWSPLGLRLDPEDPALLKRLKALTEELIDRIVDTDVADVLILMPWSMCVRLTFITHTHVIYGSPAKRNAGDSSSEPRADSFSSHAIGALIAIKNEAEGRKKGGGGGALLWSAGALAAVGFASLAAVAGKAMMASMMALMLAALTAMRGAGGGGGGGGGGGHKSVEIIKAPAHIELAPAHYETSQAYDHDHYYAAPSYEYGRTLLSRPAKTELPGRDSAAAPSSTTLYSKQTY